MPSKNIRRVVASQPLGANDAAEADRVRDLIAIDRDDIIAEGRVFLAEKRRQTVAAHGAVTIGQTIRAARETRGLTQDELAARARVAQAYLSYLEQDQCEPSLSIAARIARELEIALEVLAITLYE